MNRRKLVIAASATGAFALAGGGAWWLLQDDGDPQGDSDRIDLLAGMYSGPAFSHEPELYAVLSLTGGMPRRTSMEVRLFDLEALPVDRPEGLSVSVSNLITGEAAEAVDVVEQEDGSWAIQQTEVESDGWWQVVATCADLTASWTFLMPDPNLTGFETPPAIETEPDASAMLAACLNILTQRTSLRWWQWLSDGNSAIILSRFGVTTPESNNLPATFESHAILAGRIPFDGSPATFRAENTRTISTDEGAMRSVDGGTPEPASTIRYLPIDQYHTTYTGYEGVHFGQTAEIEGRTCQLVAFYLPGNIEAWFAFWIDVESFLVQQLHMISVNHYMHWVYYDFDQPFELGF